MEDLCALHARIGDPTNKWALTNLATIMINMDRPAEAQDVAAELVRIYPDIARGYALLAEAYSVQKEPETAYEVLTRGREVLPSNAQLAYLTLVAGFEAGRREVCTVGVPLALSQFSGFVPNLVLRARCQAIDGDLSGALATLHTAVGRGFDALDQLEAATEDFDELVRMEEFQELLRSLEDADGPADS